MVKKAKPGEIPSYREANKNSALAVRRTKRAIRDLKSELAKEKDPVVKKDIKYQIARYEEAVRVYSQR